MKSCVSLTNGIFFFCSHDLLLCARLSNHLKGKLLGKKDAEEEEKARLRNCISAARKGSGGTLNIMDA